MEKWEPWTAEDLVLGRLKRIGVIDSEGKALPSAPQIFVSGRKGLSISGSYGGLELFVEPNKPDKGGTLFVGDKGGIFPFNVREIEDIDSYP